MTAAGVRDRTVVRRAATWFGPSAAPLAGWWHLPADGTARGAAVLCPPMGSEQATAHRTMRCLADRLAEAGVAALRFDPLGTGDSAGDLGTPDLVRSWITGIADAASLAREAGAQHVVLVGMRLGATLAAAAAESSAPLRGLVLWDPCASGASFLRRERSLHLLSFPVPVPALTRAGAVEGPGVVYPAPLVAALGDLALAVPPPSAFDAGLARPVALLHREAAADTPWVRRLGADPLVDVAQCGGQEGLIDELPNSALVPRESLEDVVARVVEMLPTASDRVAPVLVERAVLSTPLTADVVEQVVRLGPRGLVGVRTEPIDGAPRRGVTVVFTHAASIYHVGPARSWVVLARRWAALGYRCVRFDQDDIGDSPGVRADALPRWYDETSVRDVVEAARAAVAGTDDSLAVTGLCFGAWAIVQSAPVVRPDAVYLLNPLTWDAAHPPQGPAEILAERADPPGPRWIEGRPRLRRAGQAVRRLLAGMGVVPAPDVVVQRLVDQGVRVTVVAGPEELEIYHGRRRWSAERDLARSGRYRLHEMPFEDHALLGVVAREHLADELTHWLQVDLPGRPVGSP